MKVLAACVRLAEGLDRSHAQVIGAVRLHDRGREYVVQLHTSGDAELELWSASRHAEAFEDLVGKPVRFEIAPARSKKAPAPAAVPDKASA